MDQRRPFRKSSEEHNARGIELADRGWLDEAAREFRKALGENPSDASVRSNLAMVLIQKGSHFDALLELVEALKHDPNDPDAHYYLGSFLNAYGHELAVREFHQALAIDSDLYEAHIHLGALYTEKGDDARALEHYQKAYAIAPDDELVAYELGSCLLERRRISEAIVHLRKLVKKNPAHIEGLVDLGIAYYLQGLYTESESILHKVLAYNENNIHAHYQLAKLYTRWNKRELAALHLSLVKHVSPTDFQAWTDQEKDFFASLNLPDLPDLQNLKDLHLHTSNTDTPLLAQDA